MAVNLSFIGGAGWQFLDDSGNPLSGGKVYTYAAGTTTPLTTYTSREGNVPNANPIVLDAAGRTPQQIWATEGLLYKYVVTTSTNVTIRTWDNIGGSVVASDLAQSLANTTFNNQGDALIGFRQSNSSGFLPGSVGRTLNDKMQEFVSVKDFGAVGDGVTDDADAILAAIAASSRVYLPAGTYYCSKTLNIKKVVLMEGEAGTIVSTTEQWPTTLKFADGVVGIFVHRSNTNASDTGVPAIVPATTGADGSIFRHLRIIRGDGLMPAAYDNKSGFWVKSRCLIEDCLVSGFSGEGIYVAATAAATTDPLLLGNANNFEVSRVRMQNNAGRGFYAIGADVNVGLISKCDASSNGRQGFLDSSFLGLTFTACHTASNGRFSQVHYGGNRYFCRSDTLGAATTPGTNSSVWYLIGAGGVSTVYPEWSSANTYYRGSAFQSTNANATSVFLGCYEEGSQPPSNFTGRTLSIGGAGTELEISNLGTRVVSDDADGFRSVTALTSRRLDSAGNTVATIVGGDPNNGDILRSFHVDHPLGWRLRFNGPNVDYRYSNLASTIAYQVTGPNTAVTLGGSAVKPYYTVIERFGLGAGSNARQQTYGAAAPTTGDWGRGAIVWNIGATAGGYAGWICVTAGSPGTWKEFGAIAP